MVQLTWLDPEKKRKPAPPIALRILPIVPGNRQRCGEINVSPDVLFDDIPDSVLEEVRLGIQHYFVPLLGS